MSVAWFPPDELSLALAEWPGLLSDFEGLEEPAAYNRKIERDLRELAAAGANDLFVAPILVAEFREWAADEWVDAGDSASRARYAAVVANRGRGVFWPPARNDSCWCRSSQKYKWCCGRA